MEIQGGNIYLIPNSEEKYGLFMDVRAGKERGLFISRENPDRLPENIRSSSSVIWLSSIRRPDAMDPYNVGILTDRISEYLADEGDAVIFLDGVEYMIEGTDFSRVFRSLGYMRERISLTDSVMLIPLDVDTLEKREFALMKREFIWKGV